MNANQRTYLFCYLLPLYLSVYVKKRKVSFHVSCHITNLTRMSKISLAIELFWSLIAKTKGNSCQNFTNTSATAQQGQFVLAPDQ